ncbi:hypothetical protein PR048_008486 [Dryococelus australis]|uniref:Uncharacterized protein n=1 Tax=Dryococelus australis TaxID=614101 RepID=A0ABQ9HX86_9NEOP|nr:hypothetical protein PR048_008486 [Dryococelus australis]
MFFSLKKYDSTEAFVTAMHVYSILIDLLHTPEPLVVPTGLFPPLGLTTLRPPNRRQRGITSSHRKATRINATVGQILSQHISAFSTTEVLRLSHSETKRVTYQHEFNHNDRLPVRTSSYQNTISAPYWDSGGAVARALASHHGDPGLMPGEAHSRDFHIRKSCCTIPLASELSRGTPVSTALAFQRRSILGSPFMCNVWGDWWLQRRLRNSLQIVFNLHVTLARATAGDVCLRLDSESVHTRLPVTDLRIKVAIALTDALLSSLGEESKTPQVAKYSWPTSADLIVNKQPTCGIHRHSRSGMHPQMHVTHMMNDDCGMMCLHVGHIRIFNCQQMSGKTRVPLAQKSTTSGPFLDELLADVLVKQEFPVSLPQADRFLMNCRLMSGKTRVVHKSTASGPLILDELLADVWEKKFPRMGRKDFQLQSLPDTGKDCEGHSLPFRGRPPALLIVCVILPDNPPTLRVQLSPDIIQSERTQLSHAKIQRCHVSQYCKGIRRHCTSEHLSPYVRVTNSHIPHNGTIRHDGHGTRKALCTDRARFRRLIIITATAVVHDDAASRAASSRLSGWLQTDSFFRSNMPLLMRLYYKRKKEELDGTLVETGVLANRRYGRDSLWKKIERKEKIQVDRCHNVHVTVTFTSPLIPDVPGRSGKGEVGVNRGLRDGGRQRRRRKLSSTKETLPSCSSGGGIIHGNVRYDFSLPVSDLQSLLDNVFLPRWGVFALPNSALGNAAGGTRRRLSVKWVVTVPHTGVTTVAGKFAYFKVAYVQALAECRDTAVRLRVVQLVVHADTYGCGRLALQLLLFNKRTFSKLPIVLKIQKGLHFRGDAVVHYMLSEFRLQCFQSPQKQTRQKAAPDHRMENNSGHLFSTKRYEDRLRSKTLSFGTTFVIGSFEFQGTIQPLLTVRIITKYVRRLLRRAFYEWEALQFSYSIEPRVAPIRSPGALTKVFVALMGRIHRSFHLSEFLHGIILGLGPVAQR